MDENDLRQIIKDVDGEPCGLQGLGQGLQTLDSSGDCGGQHKQQQGGVGGSEVRDKLKRLYKITEEELAINSLEDCVIMRMAVKDH